MFALRVLRPHKLGMAFVDAIGGQLYSYSLETWNSYMTTRREVELSIKQLPEDEVRHLAKWLQEYLDERWDRQIEADFAAGKLDRLIAKAEADIANKNVRTLDEVLCDG